MGIVDGTLFVLKEKPALDRVDSASYFNYRKQRYGFQATIICDDEKRITKFNCTFPGSVHDARAWRNMNIAQNPHQYLQGNEYLIADSAYPLNQYTIVPFKRPPNSQLPKSKRIFNERLSGLRVSVEHCIGQLKARLPSLRGLPHRIRNDRDVGSCLQWIGSCVILHNLLLDLDDEIEPCWEQPDDLGSYNEEDDRDGEGETAANEDMDYALSGKRKRDALYNAIIEEYNNENEYESN